MAKNIFNNQIFMKFFYDKQVDALSIKFSEAPYQESEEVRDNVIFDYDVQGKIVAIEVLNASAVLHKNIQHAELAATLPIPNIVLPPH